MPSATQPNVATLRGLVPVMSRAQGFAEVLAALSRGESAAIDGAWGSSCALAAAALAAAEGGAAAPRGTTAWRLAEIPSANGHGTAPAMARLYSAFAQKGRIGETRVIAPVTWEELTRERVSGEDRVLPGRVAFGAGVMRNLPLIYGPNPETLCHSGWGGSGAFGDPATGLAGAYIMNRQGTHLLEDDRRSRIIDALYGCL